MLRQATGFLLGVALLASAGLTPLPAAAQATPPLQSLELLLQNPTASLGQPIMVQARVAEVMAGQGFTVTADEGQQRRVLVVSAPTPELRADPWTGPWARDWEPGDWVTLVGYLDRFDLAAYEREYNVDVTNTFFRPWQDRPVIFAHRVDVLDR